MKVCINSMLQEPLACDKNHSYRPDKVSVYYENRKAASIHKVDLQKTVGEILSEKR